jgi:hypothetical protein
MTFKTLDTKMIGTNSINLISNSTETQFNVSIDYKKDGNPQTSYCFPIMVKEIKAREKYEQY